MKHFTGLTNTLRY